MKKLVALGAMAVVAVAGMAMAKSAAQPPVDEQVQAVIDARLHQLLVELNAKQAR